MKSCKMLEVNSFPRTAIRFEHCLVKGFLYVQCPQNDLLLICEAKQVAKLHDSLMQVCVFYILVKQTRHFLLQSLTLALISSTVLFFYKTDQTKHFIFKL